MVYLRGYYELFEYQSYIDKKTGEFNNKDVLKNDFNRNIYYGEKSKENDNKPKKPSWISERIRDIFNAQYEMEMAKYRATDAAQKNIQRDFWKFGAQHLLREKWGYYTSAWMLEHSLQDNPSDIWRGNDSRIAYLVNNDSAYLTKLDEAIKSSKNGKIDQDLE